MIKNGVLAGLLACGLFCGYGSDSVGRLSLRLMDSELRRYPAQTLFTPGGNILVAYRIARSDSESSALRIAEFDGRTGRQIVQRDYAVPSSGPSKISDGFLAARDWQTIYFVELTGNPVVLAITTSTHAIQGESTAKLFGLSDFMPRVEGATDAALIFTAGSKLPGKAVHWVGLDCRDVSKITLDEQIPAKLGFGQSDSVSFAGDSLWMGSGKYWVKIGLRSGQVESKMTAQNDVHSWAVSPSGLIGITNLAGTGYLQSFDESGRQLGTMEQSGCGFVSVQLSASGRYGVGLCQKSGTNEWGFGKTLERRAFVFDFRNLAPIATFPVTTVSVRTSQGTEDARLWRPQPSIWNSDSDILVAVPEVSGRIRLERLTLAGHDSK